MTTVKRMGVAAAAVALGAGSAYLYFKASEPVHEPVQVVGQAAAPAVPEALPQAPASHIAVTPQRAAPPPQLEPTDLQPQKLSAKFRQLVDLGRPADAFMAYQILSGCESVRLRERIYRDTKPRERNAGVVAEMESGHFAKVKGYLCGDLTDSDLNKNQRLTLIEKAAEGLVPMAFMYYAGEGPGGDPDALLTRWKDPAVQEWRAKVIQLTLAAAEKGDVAALAELANQYETGEGLIAERNPSLAIQYSVAAGSVYGAQHDNKKLAGVDKRIKDMSARLSPEQIEQAKVAGQKLASQALGRTVN
jgi:TPR repeat protein